LVLWWSFSDGTAADKSGLQNDGVVQGAPLFTAGAVRFDNPAGSQSPKQYITVPYSTSLRALETDSFTIAIRYKSTDASQQNGALFGNYKYINMSYGDGSTPCAYSGVYDLGFGSPATHFTFVPDDGHGCVGTAQTTDGVYHWQILTVDRTQGLATQYVDIEHFGIASIANFGTNPIILSGLTLGATGPSFPYAARATTVDEFCIFSRALSSDEVAALVGAGDAGMCLQPSSPTLSIRTSQVRMCWSSVVGVVYQVEYKERVDDGDWLALGTPVPGNGGEVCVEDQIPPGGVRRLYRVVATSAN